MVYIVSVQHRLVENRWNSVKILETSSEGFPQRITKHTLQCDPKSFQFDGSNSSEELAVLPNYPDLIKWSFQFFRTSHTANSSSGFSSPPICVTIELPSTFFTESYSFPFPLEGFLIVSDTFTRWQPNFQVRYQQTNILLKRKLFSNFQQCLLPPKIAKWEVGWPAFIYFPAHSHTQG